MVPEGDDLGPAGDAVEIAAPPDPAADPLRSALLAALLFDRRIEAGLTDPGPLMRDSREKRKRAAARMFERRAGRPPAGPVRSVSLVYRPRSPDGALGRKAQTAVFAEIPPAVVAEAEAVIARESGGKQRTDAVKAAAEAAAAAAKLRVVTTDEPAALTLDGRGLPLPAALGGTPPYEVTVRPSGGEVADAAAFDPSAYPPPEWVLVALRWSLGRPEQDAVWAESAARFRDLTGRDPAGAALPVGFEVRVRDAAGETARGSGAVLLEISDRLFKQERAGKRRAADRRVAKRRAEEARREAAAAKAKAEREAKLARERRLAATGAAVAEPPDWPGYATAWLLLAVLLTPATVLGVAVAEKLPWPAGPRPPVPRGRVWATAAAYAVFTPPVAIAVYAQARLLAAEWSPEAGPGGMAATGVAYALLALLVAIPAALRGALGLSAGRLAPATLTVAVSAALTAAGVVGLLIVLS